MIKKLLKCGLLLACLFAVLVVAAFFTLKAMYPPAKLKSMAQEYVSKKLNRQITFESVSFTWIGFTLKQVALSENTTFQDGTFLQADKLTAHVAVKPLLQKRIEISTIQANGLQVNFVVKPDGSLNTDTLFSSTGTNEQTTPSATDTNEQDPLVITAQKIILTNCTLVYDNQQTGLRTALSDLNITIHNFDLEKPFTGTLSFNTTLSGANQPNMYMPLRADFTTSLAGLDWARAYATITEAVARYKTIELHVKGDIKNFEQPAVDLTGSIAGITHTALKDVAPGLPNFTLPTLQLILQATADLNTQTATLAQAKINAQDSTLAAHGTVRWNGPTPTYNLTGSLIARIDQLVHMTDTLDGFDPKGTLTGTFKATEKKDYTDINGTFTFKDASIYYDPFTFASLNGDVLLNSLDDISSKLLTGKINGENFRGSFAYQATSHATDLALNMDLDKLVMARFSSKDTKEPQPTADTSTKTQPTQEDATPLNLKVNLNFGGIDIPYLQTGGLTLLANLTGITDSMQHTNGTVNFSSKPGKITNLDDFIKDSKITRILLLPITLVKKTATLLNLDLFPATDEAHGTTLNFTQAEGAYTFTDGIMNVDKTLFRSTLTDVSASGTANFQTDALNMKATATLLTQAAPVAFKITGTISQPKGKLDVVNTVTSVVGGLLDGTAVKSAANGSVSVVQGTANTATQAVKGTVSTAVDVVKGIGGLFKKKEQQEEDTAN